MKKLLPIFLFIFSLIFFNQTAIASNIEVSKSSGFASSDLNFSAGETVYARVSADPDGTGYVLNIRDNNYSVLNTVGLTKSGGTYTASFPAPPGEGYYSLEAQIKGEGLNAVSVKTIKVGSPSSANVKVNVHSSVKGTSSSENSEKPERSDKSEESEESQKTFYKVEDNEQTDENVREEVKVGLFASVFAIVDKLVNFFKLF